MSTGRWIARGATGLVAVSALAAVVGAPASATVSTVTLYPAASQYVVGEKYSVDAWGALSRMDLQNPKVTFFDNGQCIGNSGTYGGYEGGGTYASVQWIPTTPGTHELVAKHAGTTASITVTVVAAPVGSTPATPADQGGCGFIETGSLGPHGLLAFLLAGSSGGS
ncbi:hypothetical protein ACWDOP_27140 [Nocardia sp. NPDC003693]